MGQQRQQLLLMGGRYHHQINNAIHMKKYCIWGLGVVVPFLVLFCIFPSGTSLYKPLNNHIVVSQLQVSSSRARLDLEKLRSDEIQPPPDEKLPLQSRIDKPDLASKNRNDARTPGISSIDELDLSSKKKAKKSKKAKQQVDTDFRVPIIINSVIDKELEEQIGEPIADTQKKKSTKKAKIMHNTDEIFEIAVDEEVSSSRKGEADQQEDASLGLIMTKSSSGRKPDMFAGQEEEDISSLGKEISADEKDPARSKATISKQSTRKAMGLNSMESEDFIADELDAAEEEVSSLGKGRSSKQRSRKETKEVDDFELTESGKVGDEDVVEASYRSPALKEKDHATDFLFWEKADEEMILKDSTKKRKRSRSTAMEEEDHAADLLFLEKADKEMFLRDTTKKRKQGNNVQKIGEDDLNDPTSQVISKALPSTTKQSKTPGKCKSSKGRWIIDSKNHLYMDSKCPWVSINDEQSCKVIKTESKSTNWRWQPSDCNMERFEAKSFLKLMQNKSLAFIGDKLAKAQMQSLVCLLAQVEKPNLLYNDKSNQSMLWHFSSSNVKLSMVRSPYLVQEVGEKAYNKLRLDKLDTKWAVMVPTIDVIVLGIGALFIKPTIYMVRDEVVGCYACQDLATHIDIANLKEISLYSGFRAAMRSSIMGVGALPGFKGITFFLQPFGFEGNGSYHEVSMKMKKIQEEELFQARKRGSISNESKMEVLHTELVSMSKYDPIQRLITPTCLVPHHLADTWNQLLQHTLTRLSTLESNI